MAGTVSRVTVTWPRRVGKTAAAAAIETEERRMTTRDEWRAPLNPPGPDWSDRLYRRFREALRVAREDPCPRCGATGAGLRHFGWPSECPGPTGFTCGTPG